MDTFDSRSLHFLNCFGCSFRSSGTFKYDIGASSPIPPSRDGDDDLFIIEVIPPPENGAPEQRDIVVRREGTRLVAEPPRTSIAVGAPALWHAADATVRSFSIAGKIAGLRVSSMLLTNNCVFTHVFSVPGEYHWVDARRGKVRGTVRVRAIDARDPDEASRWLGSLAQGAGVTIDGDSVSHPTLEIVVGQTVFWWVRQSDGVTVTDARLLRAGKPPIEKGLPEHAAEAAAGIVVGVGRG